MRKIAVYLPNELKVQLAKVAAETGRSQVQLIRAGIQLVLDRYVPPTPTIPIMVSDDPRFAGRVDEQLAGFGER